MRARQIALFGGSFDPPHQAHTHIPVFLLEQKYVDEVWFVPVRQHPFEKKISDQADRLAMLQIVLKELRQQYPAFAGAVKVEEYELGQDEVSFTIQTLEALAKREPHALFHWVIGADLVHSFKKWHGHQQILEKFGVFVYPREGYAPLPEELLPGMTYLAAAPVIPVSSTQIRAAFQVNESISRTAALLPEVERYIKRHRLYDGVRDITTS